MNVDIDQILARLGAEVVKTELLERQVEMLKAELKQKREGEEHADD